MLQVSRSPGPGPGRVNSVFFRHFWDFKGPVLLSLVAAVRYSDNLPAESLEASVILLPKTTSGCPTAGDFRLFFFFFFLDNFVAYVATPSVLQEEGNRLSPPGFPLGPVYVN